LFGLVIALMAPDLGWSEERPLHAWRRAIPHLVLVALALFGVAGAIPLLLQGFAPQFTGFVQLGAPLIGLYLLGFAPIAAVVDGDPYREAVRRSIRAARLPGGGHLSFILLYFAFVFFLFAGVPGGPATPLTPSVATWGFTLIGSLFHVGVLGALTFRWLAVRDRLAEAPPPRR
ncbi:MAG TPA: hypothetical protein VEO00_10525, partial [Actinomycetota bacterium]|nr:hypothetical protein [Actinomycetota bacterium]